MYEKRTSPRIPCEIPIVFKMMDGSEWTATAKNLSIQGMFVGTDMQLRFGTHLEIVVRLPGGAADSTLPAIVRWNTSGGFGVQFGSIGVLETHLLADWARR